jgi:membrane protease YdiL (CAAX protease family)
MDMIISSISTTDILYELTLAVYSAGFVFLAAWWMGRPFHVRRSRMPLFFPFFQLLIWLSAAMMANEIIKRFLHDKPESTLLFAQTAASAVLQLLFGVALLCFVQVFFIRGLKGFGLRWKTALYDLFWGGLNLAAVYPVILFALYSTYIIGKLLFGSDFAIVQHQSLAELAQSGSLAVKILLVISAVIVAPFFEELMFRGLIQSTLTAYLQKPILSICLTSALFSSIHPSWTHFAGIFVLSVCLGLVYEKSGSLLRTIWMHALFNSISIVGTLAGV